MQLSYAETDVFLVCFSVVWPSSLVNVEHEWLKEVKSFNKHSIVILVGTKIDLRDDADEIDKLAKSKLKPLSPEDGLHVCAKHKLYKYVECSAKTQVGLKEVFDEAIRAVYMRNMKKSSGCYLL
jgi:small GTP-binding protein